MKLSKFAVIIALAAMGSFATVSSVWAGHCGGDVDGDGVDDCHDDCDDRIDADGDGLGDGGFPGTPVCEDTCDDRIDSDGDGVADCAPDNCPGSNVEPNVEVNDCTTNQPNSANAEGCTLNDEIADCLATFDGSECRECVNAEAQEARDEGRIQKKKPIKRCASTEC